MIVDKKTFPEEVGSSTPHNFVDDEAVVVAAAVVLPTVAVMEHYRPIVQTMPKMVDGNKCMAETPVVVWSPPTVAGEKILPKLYKNSLCLYIKKQLPSEITKP